MTDDQAALDTARRLLQEYRQTREDGQHGDDELDALTDCLERAGRLPEALLVENIIRAEDTPFVLRAANSAGATMLEYLRDLATRRGDRAHQGSSQGLFVELL